MRGRALRIVLAVLSATAVLLLVMGDIGRKSPGPVATVHAQLKDLKDGKACSGCHGGLFSSMSPSCRECHKDIAVQIKEHKGLHGAIDAKKALECSLCHGEHHGADFKLVNRLGFAQMGVPDPAQFDHQRVGWRMYGKHLELECSKCHKHADDAVLAEGDKRYLALDRDCKSCHEDVHKGRMQVACASCHGQDSFQQIQAPDHDRHLPLTGPHASANCRACHGESDGRGLEKLTARTEPGKGRTCGDCHASPHQQAFAQGAALAAGKTLKAGCEVCHRLDLTSFRDERVTTTAEQHARAGFPLAAPHEQVPCSSCHLPSLEAFTARYPGRDVDHCGACHQDPHNGQFDGDGFMAKGCTGCHQRTAFKPHGFDRDHHGRTRFALDGKHATAECEDCHKQQAPSLPRQFHDTPARCEECHQDAHQGLFAPVDAELKADRRGRCAVCHGTGTFTEPPSGFDHAHFTGFPIAGAHALVACEDCHPRAPVADGYGRTFGRVGRTGGRFAGCVACHRDPHQGGFDKAAMPSQLNGRTGCERCHEQVSFRTLPHDFDHGTFTGFPLDGVHATVGCDACHPPLDAPDANGRTWAKARGPLCADCHQDQHGGQFERLGTTDCSRCHRTATAFRNLVFRHNLDSRFRLDETHEKVACSGCHRQERIKDKMRIRYKPLKSDCVDCHGTQGTPLLRPKEGR